MRREQLKIKFSDSRLVVAQSERILKCTETVTSFIVEGGKKCLIVHEFDNFEEEKHIEKNIINEFE